MPRKKVHEAIEVTKISEADVFTPPKAGKKVEHMEPVIEEKEYFTPSSAGVQAESDRKESEGQKS